MYITLTSIRLNISLIVYNINDCIEEEEEEERLIVLTREID